VEPVPNIRKKNVRVVGSGLKLRNNRRAENYYEEREDAFAPRKLYKFCIGFKTKNYRQSVYVSGAGKTKLLFSCLVIERGIEELLR